MCVGQYSVEVTQGGATNGVRAAEPRHPAGWHFPGWLRELVFVGLLYGAYELGRGLDIDDGNLPYANGRRFLSWERDVHLDPEHALTTWLDHITVLAVPAAYLYSVLHYVITPIVLIWLYRKHHAAYGPARTWLAVSTIIALLGFYFIPTAPPRLLHDGVPDLLANVQQYGWWGGDGSVPRGFGGVTNQFAAMPSMHVGWSLWCGILIWRNASRQWVRWLGAGYPVLMVFVVLSTGNHYLIDALAGALVMAIGAEIVRSERRLARRYRKRRRRRARTANVTALDRTAPDRAAGGPASEALEPDDAHSRPA